MVRLRIVVAVVVAAVFADVAMSAPAPRLPSLTLQDQDGRSLELDSLRGRVVVVVYGGRAAVEPSIAWGRQLDGELRARGVYRGGDLPHDRPVVILAVAQMGGIPRPFRSMVRARLRDHTEAGFSLWLDWEDQLGALFGAQHGLPTVVVAGGAGDVRLVVTGRAAGAAWERVVHVVRTLS